jgi:DNA-directed RNA polymerase sigma subunit (sigma70/sigma32)
MTEHCSNVWPTLCFGLIGEDPRTLESIAAQLGVARKRVRQIKDKALARRRSSVLRGTLASHAERRG